MSDKNVSVFKFVLILFLGMIGLWAILALISNMGYGHMGFGHMNFGAYFNPGHMGGVDLFDPGTWSATSILLILLRVFCFLFIVALVIGLLLAARDYLLPDINSGRKSLSKPSAGGNLSSEKKMFCAKCGKPVGDNWKVCAYCGDEIYTAT